jgi:hypothetical protein
MSKYSPVGVLEQAAIYTLRDQLSSGEAHTAA